MMQMMYNPLSSPHEQTDTCEIITFPQLRLRAVKRWPPKVAIQISSFLARPILFILPATGNYYYFNLQMTELLNVTTLKHWRTYPSWRLAFSKDFRPNHYSVALLVSKGTKQHSFGFLYECSSIESVMCTIL